MDRQTHQSWSDEGTRTVGSPRTTEAVRIAQGTSEKALPQYTLDEVGDHWEAKSCWVVLFDLVYDVTEFLHQHPGGSEILLEHAGHDSTRAFQGKGHSEEAHKLLEKYCIGQLVSSERIY
ncbi:cytochrome b5-like [Patiria miniata]|uniref:Cytochrome b5 heme-binding domain-containing protein n=1 Tax=Patiria miniata TaxID=46514 RepID=A0A914BKG3_PATMI|nr:cytochrome b5-like [Patiria miniata]XP_038076599.1 cytochrome b5-like [Patiria miniata]